MSSPVSALMTRMCKPAALRCRNCTVLAGDAEGGRGLQLVAGLAPRWGWRWLADEICHLQWADRWILWVSLGRCLRRTKVVGEGLQISRLRCGQVGERRGGLAWGGSVSERRPGENGDSDVEGVVAKRPPVAVAGWKAAG